MESWKKITKLTTFGLDLTNDDWNRNRLDPYLVWTDITNFVDVGGRPKQWYPITIELKKEAGNVRKFAELVGIDGKKKDGAKWIQIDKLYLGTDVSTALEQATFCTAIVTKEFYKQLPELQKYIERFEIALALVLEKSITQDTDFQYPKPARPQNPEVSAIVGIIDDGISFAHERFRQKDGITTRIEYMWDQRYFSSQIRETWYGQELTKEKIDVYIKRSTRGGIVDENSVYNLADYEAVRRRLAHGTFVLNIACGEDPKQVHQNTPHIVAVQLQAPSRKTRDRSAGWLSARVLDGLRYILDRADRVNRGCPVIVNLSFGTTAGPHDGSSLLERAIDQLIELRNANNQLLKVVIAAGNSNIKRCHARFSLSSGDARSMQWRALPDDPTPNFMEIWFPETDSGGNTSNMAIQVTSPTGVSSGWIQRGNVYTWQPNGTTLCTIAFLNKVSTGDGNMILVALAPTFSHDPRREVAPLGTWQIAVQNLNAGTSGELEINAWIQRDETPFGLPQHARQSRFEDRNYKRFDEYGRLKDDDDSNGASYIKREGTVNGIATGNRTEAIGGFRRSDGTPARYSASGPKRSSKNGKAVPDALAVSDDSVTCYGVLSAGSRSGSVVAMDGTSVAAPQITRQYAFGVKSKSLQPIGPSGNSGSKQRIPEIPQQNATADLAASQEVARKLRYTLKPITPRPSDSGPVRVWKPQPSAPRAGHGRVEFSTPDSNRGVRPPHNNWTATVHSNPSMSLSGVDGK